MAQPIGLISSLTLDTFMIIYVIEEHEKKPHEKCFTDYTKIHVGLQGLTRFQPYLCHIFTLYPTLLRSGETTTIACSITPLPP